METINFQEAESACIEAVSKLAALDNHLELMVERNNLDESQREVLGGLLYMSTDTLNAVKVMNQYIQQEAS